MFCCHCITPFRHTRYENINYFVQISAVSVGNRPEAVREWAGLPGRVRLYEKCVERSNLYSVVDLDRVIFPMGRTEQQ